MIIDIYSRCTVGWLIAGRESAVLAEQLLADTIAKHGIDRDTLTIHADNRSSPLVDGVEAGGVPARRPELSTAGWTWLWHEVRMLLVILAG